MTAMVPTVLNTCKLCQKSVAVVGPLKLSHVIPKFLLKHTKGPGGRAIVFKGEENQTSLAQFDWKEVMLCELCEKVMQQHENLIQETLFLRRKKPALLDGPNLLVLSVESDRLATALLTIFWRAAVAEQEVFRWTFLPSYFSEWLRGAISAGFLEYQWHQHIGIRIQQVIDDAGKVLPILHSPVVRDSPSNSSPWEFVFIFAGLCITFAIPSPANNSYFRKRAIVPNSAVVRIEKVRYRQIPELKRGIRRMLSSRPDPRMSSQILSLLDKKTGRSRMEN